MVEIAQKMEFDLEYFFELAPDLLCIAGFDGYFKKINPAVSKTLGYSSEELMNSPIDTFIHPDDREITTQRRSVLHRGQALVNFENRYLAKDGSVIWLSWTSVPVNRQKLVFAIAKNITHKKQLEDHSHISAVLSMINKDHTNRFGKPSSPLPVLASDTTPASINPKHQTTMSDQLWLDGFEGVVRKNILNPALGLRLISSELNLSPRQLFRTVDRILGITPNKLVRIIRLQIAWEAIASGRYRTIKEISSLAGFSSRSHFSNLFRQTYGINATELM